MTIPHYVTAISELNLTRSGQVELAPFSEAAIFHARQMINKARGISNYFSYFRSLAFKYDQDKGNPINWQLMYSLREYYGVKDSDTKYTGVAREATTRIEVSPVVAAEIVIQSLKESNFDTKVRLGLTSNPWWSLISPEEKRLLLRKFPWYQEFVTEPQERSGIALMLEEVSKTIVEKKSNDLLEPINKDRIPKNKTVYTPRPLPTTTTQVVNDEDIQMLW